jgi:hypothetical protein
MVTMLDSPGLGTYAKMVEDVDEDEEEPIGPIVIRGNAGEVYVSMVEVEGAEWVNAGSRTGSMDDNVGQDVTEGSGCSFETAAGRSGMVGRRR